MVNAVARPAVVMAICLGLWAPTAATAAPKPKVDRISTASNGLQTLEQAGRASFGSIDPQVSGDGRFVAFTSSATDLVPGDTNESPDVFVREIRTGSTTRVSVSSDGTEGDGWSTNPSISGDGRFVAFHSSATNLVADDDNARSDVFVHDRATGATTLVSIATDGTAGDDHSQKPSISDDGRYVAFVSLATDLDPDVSGSGRDIYVHDRVNGSTSLVSAATDGTRSPSHDDDPVISGDGRFVAFQAQPWADMTTPFPSYLFAIFVRDLMAGTTEMISISDDGTPANSNADRPAISTDGRFVAFTSGASNLVDHDVNGLDDVFVRDRATSTTVRVSESAAGEGVDRRSSISGGLSLAGDGSRIAFHAVAGNLVPDDDNFRHDVFVRDMQTDQLERLSTGLRKSEGNDDSLTPSLSDNGLVMAFASSATNLVRNDTNDMSDIFVSAPARCLHKKRGC